MALLFGNAALTVAGTQENSAGATWLILILTFGWAAGLLVGAGRLLTGRSWAGLAVLSGVLALLPTVGLLRDGPGGATFGLLVFAWLVTVAVAVLPCLPRVRHWVAARRQERLFPGSAQRTPSRS